MTRIGAVFLYRILECIKITERLPSSCYFVQAFYKLTPKICKEVVVLVETILSAILQGHSSCS